MKTVYSSRLHLIDSAKGNHIEDGAHRHPNPGEAES